MQIALHMAPTPMYDQHKHLTTNALRRLRTKKLVYTRTSEGRRPRWFVDRENFPFPNENVLVGFRCPHCFATAPFNIDCTAVFTDISDNGTEDYHEVLWNEDSYTHCKNCGSHGTAKEFTEANWK